MIIDIASLWSFLLIFVRITTFMVTAPIFSGRQIPNTYKVALGVILSLLTVGLVEGPADIEAWSDWNIAVMLLKEFLVGITLGMVASFFFYAVQMAGSLMDMLIGFSMATLYDPSFGTNMQLTGRFKNIIAFLVLFSIDGHHMLIRGILTSFEWVSLDATIPSWLDGRLSTFLLECMTQMFLIGFMMAAPIVGTLFIVDVALGIISRTVPQMNMFTVFPPIKILVHFLIYILVLPSFFYLLKLLFENMFDSMFSILKIMGA
ncbi:flagellar type III secretion system protein FliR [Bacillus sp. DNRA2]|uniref:flagellar biosynthetic protein FliR n=1 Tax=Bacillus sp. DNRA2 TaxID=2723053 RepID=UPI00145EAD8C|nr:flagellar biosynthetic protein FliR [Bacillus sp. DNRA2]NMD69101.1 flagellar type III secretion system protein FliR [Bacillus sp. DNRA2]